MVTITDSVSLRSHYFRLLYLLFRSRRWLYRMFSSSQQCTQIDDKIPCEGDRWFALHTLYQDLTLQEIFYAEQAIRNCFFGKYNDAHFIIDQFIVENSEQSFITLLLRAEVYDFQALYQSQIDCLEKARISVLSITHSSKELIVHLICLNIAAAKASNEGLLESALHEARRFREWAVSEGLHEDVSKYSDLMIRCVFIYHRIIDMVCRYSNWIARGVDGNLPQSEEGTAISAMTKLRQHLQKENRFNECVMAVKSETHRSGDVGQFNPYEAFFAKRWTVSNRELLSYKFRFLRIWYADALADKGQNNRARNEIKKAGSMIYPNSRLELLRRMIVVQLDTSLNTYERAIGFQDLADRALLLNDGPLHNKFSISAAAAANAVLSTPEHHSMELQSPKAIVEFLTQRRKLRVIQKHCLTTTMTSNASTIALALGSVGSGMIQEGKNAQWLEHYHKFWKRFPKFNVPITAQAMHIHAVSAAEKLGDLVAVEELKCKAMDNLRNHPGVAIDKHGDTRAITSLGRDADLLTKIHHGLSVIILKERSCVRDLIRYACHDLGSYSVKESDLAEILFVDAKSTRLREELEDLDVETVAEKIWGVEKATDPPKWGAWFDSTQQWLLPTLPDMVHLERHETLVAIADARQLSWGQYAVDRLNNVSGQPLAWLKENEHETQRYLHLLKRVDPKARSDREVIRQEVLLASNIMLFYFNSESRERITDEDLAKSQRIVEADAGYLREIQHLRFLKHRLGSLAKIMQARLEKFGTVDVTQIFDVLQEIDELFYKLADQGFILRAFENFQAGIQAADDADIVENYDFGVLVACIAFYGWIRKNGSWSAAWISEMKKIGKMPDGLISSDLLMSLIRRCNPSIQKIFDPKGTAWSEFQSIVDFVVTWTQKAKSRALMSSLSRSSELPGIYWNKLTLTPALQTLFDQWVSLMEEHNVENTIGRSLQLYEEVEECIEKIERSGGPAGAIFGLLRGRTVKPSELKSCIDRFEEDIVFVDWIKSPIFTNEGNIVMAIYINGVFELMLPTGKRLEDVQDWVSANMDPDPDEDAIGKEEFVPLIDDYATYRLEEMNDLLKGLEKFTRPGQTLVFCPIGSLHRIPLHALKVDGEPWITRNPIVYCQSLTLLTMFLRTRWSACDWSQDPAGKVMVYNPLKEEGPWNAVVDVAEILETRVEEVDSSESVKESFKRGLEDAHLIHFHGHVRFDESTPMQHHMELSQPDYDEDGLLLELPDDSKLTAKEIFEVRLMPGAHITTISCKSGRSNITNANEHLGLATALHAAGAASMVSSLWKIHRDVGARFSQSFYRHLSRQSPRYFLNAKMMEAHGYPFIDMAQAMQNAVLEIMKDENGSTLAPYFWASLTLSGNWCLPYHWIPHD